MARFFGSVGYATPAESANNGIWVNQITERAYYGDILNETRTHDSGDKVNDDIRLSQRVSIVADAYALGNYSYIKYVKDGAGVFWAVTSIELKRPRLILSTGGVYHGPKPQ